VLEEESLDRRGGPLSLGPPSAASPSTDGDEAFFLLGLQAPLLAMARLPPPCSFLWKIERMGREDGGRWGGRGEAASAEPVDPRAASWGWRCREREVASGEAHREGGGGVGGGGVVGGG